MAKEQRQRGSLGRLSKAKDVKLPVVLCILQKKNGNVTNFGQPKGLLSCTGQHT